MTHTCRMVATFRRETAVVKIAALSLALFLLALVGGTAQAQTALAAPPPNLLAETTWGGQFSEEATGVARAGSSTYLVGSTSSFAVDQFGQPANRGFIVKLANGGIVWQRIWNGETIGGPSDWSVAVAPDGSVYLAGITADNGNDAALVKFDANGSVLWERTWGGVETDGARGVAVAADGSVYIGGRTTSFPTGSAGTFVVKFDAAGNVVWQRVWDGTAGADGLTVGPDGSVYAAASIIRNNNLAQFDIITLKISPAGSLVWARTYSAGEVVDARGGMAAASDGSVYLAGAIQRAGGGGIIGIEGLLVKLSAAGGLLFDKACCTRSGDTFEGGVAVGPDGSVHVAGTTTSLGPSANQDALVVRFQATGKKLTGAATWGTASFETGGGIDIEADGTVLLAATVQTPPPYTLAGATAKASGPKGVMTTPAGELVAVSGTVADPAQGADEPAGSTTFAGFTDAALVRFTLPQ